MTQENLVATGTYTGNATGRTIVVGWEPALVFTFSTLTGGSAANRAMCSKMPGQAGQIFAENSTAALFPTTNGIVLASNGFTLGTKNTYNNSGTTFHWCAIRKSPSVDTGSFVGNGSSQSVILGRQSPIVLINEQATWGSCIRLPEFSGSNVSHYTTAVVVRTTGGIAPDATGFTLPTAFCNVNTITTPYVAMYGDPRSSTSNFVSGIYPGTGGTQSILLNRRPKMVWAIEGQSLWWVFAIDGVTGTFELNVQYDFLSAGNKVVITDTGFDASGVLNAIGWNHLFLAFF